RVGIDEQPAGVRGLRDQLFEQAMRFGFRGRRPIAHATVLVVFDAPARTLSSWRADSAHPATDELRTCLREIGGENRLEPRRDVEDAILAALALVDADAYGHEVDVGDPERCQLTDPNAGVEERGHDRVVPLPGEIRERAKL